MNKPPAFQFYPDDFLGGVVTMNFPQRGLYITLLCIQWNRGYVTQDDFDDLVGDGTAIAQPMAKRVFAKFKKGEDGFFRNERLERERTKQAEYRKNRSESGKAGADKRWHSHSTAIAQPMANDSSPSPSPSLSIEKTNGLRPIAFNGRLTPPQNELSERFATALGNQWDDGNGRKWMKRCRDNEKKSKAVVAELESAIKEERVKTTPAQYAEQVWKEFK